MTLEGHCCRASRNLNLKQVLDSKNVSCNNYMQVTLFSVRH